MSKKVDRQSTVEYLKWLNFDCKYCNKSTGDFYFISKDQIIQSSPRRTKESKQSRIKRNFHDFYNFSWLVSEKKYVHQKTLNEASLLMTFLPRIVVKECCFNYQAINSTGEAATRENIDKLCEITWRGGLCRHNLEISWWPDINIWMNFDENRIYFRTFEGTKIVSLFKRKVFI